MTNKGTKAAVALVAWFFCVLPLAADGFLIIERPFWPHPVIEPDDIMPRPLPQPEPASVKYHRVTVAIDQQVATTKIDQAFRNDYDQDMEGTYIFPLPEDAAISEFVLYMNGQRVAGEILDKDKARQIYEEIVRKMKDPGLLEYAGRNMFKARVYPIPRHGEARIEISYHQTLKLESGLCRYVYPLNTEKFSPKPLEDVSLSVKVSSKVPLKSVYSPSHKVDVKLEANQATCGFEEKNVKPDKDFILYYAVSEKDVGLNLVCHHPAGADGYFLLLLSPGELDAKVQDKDILYVLDTSGSMAGEKLKQAQSALRYALTTLGKGDRFNLISFATDVRSFRDALVPVKDDILQTARDYVDKLEGVGGTNINDALLQALKQFHDPNRPRMVVFLTDGEPTVGVTDIKDLAKNLEDANKTQARIFVFGVGNDVNTHLLDNIAEAHRGAIEYVVPGENLEVKVSGFCRKISDPVLTDVKLDFGKIRVRDLYPGTLPDLFKGSQLVVAGRYEGEGATALILTGKVPGQEKKLVFEDKFPGPSMEHDFIPRLWATRKIGYLTNEIRLKGENKELVDEIVALSKKHGIMTAYTSFLVMEKERDRAPGSPPVQTWIQNSIRADSLYAPSMEDGKAFGSAMRKTSGVDAVRGAREVLRMQREENAPAPSLSTVRTVGPKTFYQDGEIWVDADYQAGGKVKEIKYLSDEYFSLLRAKPGLEKYLAVSRAILVVWEQESYKIVE